MSDLGQARRSTLLDAAWRTAYRVGFPLARIWWRLRHQQHEGALVAVYVGQTLLLVRSSYRIEWNFPGGTVRHGETPEVAARRDLRFLGLRSRGPTAVSASIISRFGLRLGGSSTGSLVASTAASTVPRSAWHRCQADGARCAPQARRPWRPAARRSDRQAH